MDKIVEFVTKYRTLVIAFNVLLVSVLAYAKVPPALLVPIATFLGSLGLYSRPEKQP